MVVKTPKIFEFIGVAGSGKTTLTKYLLKNHESISCKPRIKRIKYLFIWLCSIIEVVRLVLWSNLSRPHGLKVPDPNNLLAYDKRYRLFEVKQLINLVVLVNVIRKISNSPGPKIVIIDQGPLFIMSALNVVCGTSQKPILKTLMDKIISRYIEDTLRGIADSFECLKARWKVRSDWQAYKAVFGTSDQIVQHHLAFRDEYFNLTARLKDGTVNLVTLNEAEFDLKLAAGRVFEE